ncbi:hypothetical protein [Aquimarina algiphila]|uniref:hypothetical protein n=1 Tax=Aquimarina algiphila TaxID=2047982 RepID=UPI0024923192|nr:hypothetical protein [Aquimarina algiphila]
MKPNLDKSWKLSIYNEKQRLQKLLFPEGILYSKKKDKIKTLKTNPIMEIANYISISYNKKKARQNCLALVKLS